MEFYTPQQFNDLPEEVRAGAALYAFTFYFETRYSKHARRLLGSLARVAGHHTSRAPRQVPIEQFRMAVAKLRLAGYRVPTTVRDTLGIERVVTDYRPADTWVIWGVSDA